MHIQIMEDHKQSSTACLPTEGESLVILAVPWRSIVCPVSSVLKAFEVDFYITQFMDRNTDITTSLSWGAKLSLILLPGLILILTIITVVLRGPDHHQTSTELSHVQILKSTVSSHLKESLLRSGVWHLNTFEDLGLTGYRKQKHRKITWLAQCHVASQRLRQSRILCYTSDCLKLFSTSACVVFLNTWILCPRMYLIERPYLFTR